MKKEAECRAMVEKSMEEIVEEIKAGELMLQFSMGYKWDDSPENDTHRLLRQVCLQAITVILKTNTVAIMTAARDCAQDHIDEWLDSPKDKHFDASTKLLMNLQEKANGNLH